MNLTLYFLRVKLAILAAFNGKSGDFKKHDFAYGENNGEWRLPTTHPSPRKRSHSSALRDSHRGYTSTPLPREDHLGSPIELLLEAPSLRRRTSRRRHPITLAVGGFVMAVILLVVIYFAPFWASIAPVIGLKDSYTIVFLSYTPRLAMLRGAIRHYSRCPSASNIVVVWNSGPPPDLALLPSSVPIRIRVESTNSLNNRFRPDPEITTKAVLSMDDDIRIPCRDIEAAFAAWRLNPDRMTGFFPRLIDGEQNLVFRGEGYVMENDQYNAVLTGAAFLDASKAFSAYWDDAVAPARAAVDAVFNGEDMLMNFVLSNASGPGNQAVQFIRPSRRLDISKLSGVGISHNMAKFEAAAIDYFHVFLNTFGRNPLNSQDLALALRGGRKPFFCGTFIGCTYI